VLPLSRFSRYDPTLATPDPINSLEDFRSARRDRIVPHSQIKRPDAREYHGGYEDEAIEGYARPERVECSLQGDSMEGIHFVTNEKGRKIAVQIDLDRHGELWEDIFDQLLADERSGDKREWYATVKKRMVRAGKLRG